MMKRLMLAAAVAAMLITTGCDKTQSTEQVRTVIVSTPQLAGTGGGQVSLPGVVKEAQNVKAAFKSAGQLMTIQVKEGDYVSKGQLIATLDDVDYQIALDAAQSQYTQLKSEVGRVKQLYERGSVSANEYEKAQSGLEQAEAQMKAKQNQVDYTRLYSPASGYVEDVFFHTGEMVDAGTPVLSLIDATDMQVEVNIPVDIYRQRQSLSGFQAQIGDQNYDMSLVSITPKTDGTQMYKMLLRFPSSANMAMASGANAAVTFNVSGAEEQTATAWSIPVTALFYEGATPCVWVVGDDATVQKRELRLSTLSTDGMAVVEQGISGADRVVKAGVKHLHQGDKVEILDRECSTNVGGLL